MAGNMNSGRNARSTQEHIADGTYRPDRHGGFETPAAPSGKPEPPRRLSRIARAEWDRMVWRLDQCKTLALVDDGALYQYAELYAEVERLMRDDVKARRMRTKLEKAMRGLEGEPLVLAIEAIARAQHGIDRNTGRLRMGHLAIRSYLVEFGMTPSARSRVKIPTTPKSTSKLMEFMGKQAKGA